MTEDRKEIFLKKATDGEYADYKEESVRTALMNDCFWVLGEEEYPNKVNMFNAVWDKHIDKNPGIILAEIEKILTADVEKAAEKEKVKVSRPPKSERKRNRKKLGRQRRR